MEALHTTMVLNAGEKLEDADLYLADDFATDSSNCAIRVQGDNVQIRRVRLFGYPTNLGWVAPQLNLVGIRALDVQYLGIEDVTIDGFPNFGVKGFGWTECLVSDVQIHHCYGGVNLSSHPQGLSSPLCTFERITVTDTWAPTEALGLGPSRSRPGGWVGGSGLSLNTIHHSKVIECRTSGECTGVKISYPLHTDMERCQVAKVQFQGHESGEAFARILDCTIDKGLGYGEGHSQGNALHLTGNLGGLLKVEARRCTLLGAGLDGHGIQNQGAELFAKACGISNFEGERGGLPAHALHLSHGGTVTNDFVADNTFWRQPNLVLTT